MRGAFRDARFVVGSVSMLLGSMILVNKNTGISSGEDPQIVVIELGIGGRKNVE